MAFRAAVLIGKKKASARYHATFPIPMVIRRCFLRLSRPLFRYRLREGGQLRRLKHGRPRDIKRWTRNRNILNFAHRDIFSECSDFASPPDWPVAHPDASGARLRRSTETSLYRGQSRGYRRAEESEHSELFLLIQIFRVFRFCLSP